MLDPAVIIDLDGTLADCSHRLHHIQGEKKDWAAFFAGIPNDPLIRPTAEILYAYLDIQANMTIFGAPRILFVTGRPENTRQMTIEWLQKHYFPIGNDACDEVNCPLLFMRVEGDFRPDAIIKEEILNKILESYEIKYVIDDRESCVQMWQRHGLFVFQVKSPLNNNKPNENLGVLTLMVGPTCAGKSRFLRNSNVHVISSDKIREQIFGTFSDPSKYTRGNNDKVFSIVHNLARSYIQNGLDCIIDATNLRRSDRRAAIDFTGAKQIRYIVIDRPLDKKLEDAGWRENVPGLIEKHHWRFQSMVKEILKGDDLGIEVIDLRSY